MKQVDGANKVVKSEEGTEAKYDARGFIPTDKTKLTMEGARTST